MNEQKRTDIKGYDELAELALDLRWSWMHSGDMLWRELDASLWDLTHNPWAVLQTVSKEKLIKMLSDPHFQQILDNLLKVKRLHDKSTTWFQQNYPNPPIKCIAYFSMEFMLSEALPIYSGGLGNVAGDQLKAASDLGIPVIAIGLLYQQGYFRQMIDKEGTQQALYPYNDPGQLPIKPLRKANGEWLRIEIKLPGWPIWVRVWQVQVGRVKLYLLDSNDIANFPIHRGITSELYGGGSELRLKQEMLLGICGWRLLEEIGAKPDVCHLNEGHAAFAVLERAKSYMLETGVSFETALAATRPGNLFTTHTAVSAGFDRFSPFLIEQYLGTYARDQLKISLDDFLALGRQNPQDQSEPFNMAFLAIRGSGAINGVSLLHEKVSKHILDPLFPHWPEEEIPIGHVTNGVHMPSWDSQAADDLWTKACGKNRWLGSIENLEKAIRQIPEDDIWQMRNSSRKSLIEYARTRLSRQLSASGFPDIDVEQAKRLFDPNILTLGFARRFATYKRPNMLLQNPERLLRILNNPDRPVQLIIAGKAHPADKPGQALIQEWIRFIRSSPETRSHIMFIGDYDMLLTEQLVAGVDVWINTPRRPWEACGTSGMKILVNGGLNLSELDGWWAEAYNPQVGWAIGDGKEHDSDASWDVTEANELYDILENQVIPEFYQRDTNGIPSSWIAKIKESMATLTPRYSASRSVREYLEKYYIPAANSFANRIANHGALAKDIVTWQHLLKSHWHSIKFEEINVETTNGQHHFKVRIFLDDIPPSNVSIQLYADPIDNGPPVIQSMSQMSSDQQAKSLIFEATVSADRPKSDYTPRIIPSLPEASIPLEANEILWCS